MPENPVFDRIDVDHVHSAMMDAEATAAERNERMPSSAEAYRNRAAGLRVVRDKILKLLPELGWLYRR